MNNGVRIVRHYKHPLDGAPLCFSMHDDVPNDTKMTSYESEVTCDLCLYYLRGLDVDVFGTSPPSS